jgi:hypothetical protein
VGAPSASPTAAPTTHPTARSSTETPLDNAAWTARRAAPHRPGVGAARRAACSLELEKEALPIMTTHTAPDGINAKTLDSPQPQTIGNPGEAAQAVASHRGAAADLHEATGVRDAPGYYRTLTSASANMRDGGSDDRRSTRPSDGRPRNAIRLPVWVA